MAWQAAHDGALVLSSLRMLDSGSLQQALGARVNELQQALSSVRVLSGLLPICAYCKRIRDDKSYWTQIEQYLSVHSDARFSHGICPECLVKHADE